MDPDVLRIVRVNGSGKHRQVNVFGDIFSTLADMDGDAFIAEPLCQCGGAAVGPGYCEAAVLQDLGETAHGDAADADKINVNGILEINLIHDICSFVTLFELIITCLKRPADAGWNAGGYFYQ